MAWGPSRSPRLVCLAAVAVYLILAHLTMNAAAPVDVWLSPQDTTLNLDTINYSTSTRLNTYTWPANKVANAILMKFDFSIIPVGSVINQARLRLWLAETDVTSDPFYNVAAYKIIGKNAVVATATGYTIDGTAAWTANACCSNGVPMAQADHSPYWYAVQAIDKTLGEKSWFITELVQEWMATPATNFGLLLNSDATRAADHYRFFASMEDTDSTRRPYLYVNYTPPAADTTAPTVSMTAPAPSTTVAGTIPVSANASDNVGVAGVQFKLDGANLGAEDTSAPYSISWNTQTASNGAHTLTAVARDATGNATTSAAVPVTVLNDVTPPILSAVTSTSITGSGATITWTSNEASDSQVDYGTTTAYGSTSTLSASLVTAHTVVLTGLSGSTQYHYRVRSRDASGNLALSSDFTFTTLAATGTGIASRYPGDIGIELDPDVVFVERFDEVTLTNLFTRWTDILNGSNMLFGSDVPPGSPQTTSLTIPWIGGTNNGGHLYKLLSPGVDTSLYVRFYIKYPTTRNYTHSGVWIGGYNPPLSWPNAQAGIKPTGSDRFSASGETFAATGKFDHYDYWMGMHQSGDGNFWGNLLLNDPTVQVPGGQWVCVEHMVKLNSPVTSSNGERAIWIDGVKVSHLGQGFPNGTWSGGIFTQGSGTPFTGFQFRNTASLNLNYIWLQNYTPDTAAGRQDMKFAHLVAAKSYIGCLASGSPNPDTTPPTVSITAPSPNATVSGSTVIVTASATDNVGVAGIQFKLDGANLGAEVTGGGSSITWDTTQTSNGGHTLTAVARDFAGNTRTSTAVSVTVSNASGSLWPNEPTGMTLLTDWGFDQVPPSSGDVSISGSPGWHIVENAPVGSSRGWTVRVSDSTAPLSASNVYDFVYPQGMVEGNAPSSVYWPGINRDEVFVGFWWKPSSPFDYGPNGNKIVFIYNGGGASGGQQFMILKPNGKLEVLPEYPGDYRWRTPNVNSTFVTLGVWHKIEWYSNVSTGTNKWWLDGVLQGSYTDVRNSVNFDMLFLSPTWGGNIGARKAQTDHYWYDHFHLSAR